MSSYMTMKQVVDSTLEENKCFHNDYSHEEEALRVAYHYEGPPEFMNTVVGGKWNIYSSSFFEEGDSLTDAQERKLDIFADLMHLKPGMRILDIGFGWGGPLTYLCKKYGVSGVGLTVTPSQVPFAEERAAKHGVDAKFILSHWAEYEDSKPFDAVYSDEVLSHVYDLKGYYQKSMALLKPGGIALNKELHFTKETDSKDRLATYINSAFGFTGNYRLLEEELVAALNAGFVMESLYEYPMDKYIWSVREHWIKNLLKNKKRLVEITSEEYFFQYYKYLRCVLVMFRGGVFRNHTLAFKKLS